MHSGVITSFLHSSNLHSWTWTAAMLQTALLWIKPQTKSPGARVARQDSLWMRTKPFRKRENLTFRSFSLVISNDVIILFNCPQPPHPHTFHFSSASCQLVNRRKGTSQVGENWKRMERKMTQPCYSVSYFLLISKRKPIGNFHLYIWGNSKCPLGFLDFQPPDQNRLGHARHDVG